MSDAPEQERTHAEVDHGVRHVQAHFVVAHQPAPARHASERPLDERAPWQHLEALLACEFAHHLDGGVLVGAQAREPAPVVGAGGASRARRDGCLSQGHLRRTALRISSAPAASCASAVVRFAVSRRPSVSTATWRLRPFTFLPASQPAPPGALGAFTVWLSSTPALGLLAAQHERHVVDGREQHPSHEAAQSPAHGFPRAEVDRDYAPAASRARRVRIAFSISRRSTSTGRPHLASGGSKG